MIVCEPYYTGSHRAWADGLAAHSAHDVRLVTHAGGFWKWRMQGGALTLASGLRDATAGWGRPDVLLASSMVHLPALAGFARAELTGVPLVLYMHENQLTYPPRDGSPPDHTYAMTNWLSMAAADAIAFNSVFHRDAVFARLPAFLRQFPDHRHGDAVDAVAARTCVLPVGVDIDRFAGPRVDRDRPTVLWNHRWEYDKNPTVFFDALDALVAENVDFDLIVAGEMFQTVPDEFGAAQERFADRLVHFGMASEAEYPELLRRADVVVSTATHEFFGVAVVEAIAAGAMPVLPDRLSYPELVPASSPYLYADDRDLVDRLRWALTARDARRDAAIAAQDHVRRFDWRYVAPHYDAWLSRVAAR